MSRENKEENETFIDKYLQNYKLRFDSLHVFLSSQGVYTIITIADFFFNELKKASEKEISFYLFGFTVATRSISDHILHDYHVKYFSNNVIKDRIEPMFIERGKLNIKIFKCDARKYKHKEALRFAKFWDEKINKFKKDRKMKFLKDMRDITVHRKVVTRPHIIIIKNGEMGFGLEKRDSSGKIIFHEPDGIAFCKYCLNEMKKFVDEIKAEF